MQVSGGLPGLPLIRQTKASPYCDVPLGSNPAPLRALTPLVDAVALVLHLTWVPPPREPKLTTTVTPLLVVQAPLTTPADAGAASPGTTGLATSAAARRTTT